MRGGVQLTIAIASLLTVTYVEARCDRTPTGTYARKTPSDGRFKLIVHGNPTTYVPGQAYEVSLKGTRIKKVPQKFTGFMLTVEPDDSSNTVKELGSFELYNDLMTTFSEKCQNTVTQSSWMAKSDIQVRWLPPPAGSGCVVLRATVIENRDIWYMDDGDLSKKLCEEPPTNKDDQPPLLDRCCACDEAKYEVTFEGLWSRHTHPKDFPSNGWLTRFSDVIGASHTANYSFWQYGGMASEGLRQVAERGSTRMLESELKAESEHIRTIIKARGISYPNVTGKTFAVFRVDRKHHLMSLVSMIDPSPDWIVGVSELELCQRNCTWADYLTLNLYPWDVGTDSGTTYISPDTPTIPKDIIRQITSTFPNDPASPFYDPGGSKMKPLARLHLTRQRLYEKSCADDSISTEEEYFSDDCAVTEWTRWSPCSDNCVQYRQRNYINPSKSEVTVCNVPLFERQPCRGRSPFCRGKTEYGSSKESNEDPRCRLSEWGDWSSCSETCGPGSRARSRMFLDPTSRKHCLSYGGIQLQQTDICWEQNCTGDGEEGHGHGQGPPDLTGSEPCPWVWTDWSHCSVTCGVGIRMRTRQVLRHPSQPKDPDCDDMEKTETVKCIGDYGSCDENAMQADVICKQPKFPGPCKPRLKRWYYDENLEGCVEFMFGCRPNHNNFLTKEDCESTCTGLTESTDSESTDGPFKDFQPGNQIRSTDPSGHYGIMTSTLPTMTTESLFPNQPVDCKLSEWSVSECSSTCGVAYSHLQRHVIQQPMNGGKPCRKLHKKKRCKHLPKCAGGGGHHNRQKDSQETHHNHRRVRPYPYSGDCILSEWMEWSPCSATCGQNAIRQRTRNILVYPISEGAECEHRIETVTCSLLPCRN